LLAYFIRMKKVLIVDDSDLIRQSLQRVFNHYPVEVSLASNGADAMTKIYSDLFDLCLLEVCLPDVSGIEVMRRIRSVSPSTRIAIMTAPPISDDSAGFVSSEANYFIEKPFDLSEIKSLAKMLFDGKPRA
jgi:DNA-binding response OmpR family regulator